MALTTEGAAQRARDLITDQSEAQVGLALPDIAAMIPTALEKFGRRIALGPHYQQLQKDFPVTPTAGVVDLTSLAGILFDKARSRVRVSSGNVPIVCLDSYDTLALAALPADAVLCAENGTNLVFLDTAGSLIAYATAVKITANFVPALADISTTTMEGIFVETLAELALAQLERNSTKLKSDISEEMQVGRA